MYKTRKITLKINISKLKQDLRYYCKKAIELGASDVKIIPAKSVIFDERVRLKCLIPKCHLYGECTNCPPYMPEVSELKRILKKYKHCIIFKCDVVPKEDFVDDEKWHRAHIQHQNKVHQITTFIESLAFNHGYYFATGFGAGGCKSALCNGQICQVIDSGRCRFPLKSRPSMESAGIDVFKLVSKIGWEIYPVAIKDIDPDSVKCAISVGIVFII